MARRDHEPDLLAHLARSETGDNAAAERRAGHGLGYAPESGSPIGRIEIRWFRVRRCGRV